MSIRSNSAVAASILASTTCVLGALTSAAGATGASATHVPPPCSGEAYSACAGTPIIHIVCGALGEGASHPSDGRDIILDVEGVRVADANDQRLFGLAQVLATRACRPAPDEAESADQYVTTHRCGGTPIALPRPCAV